MGVEDWEVKYKMWDKGSLNEFLDKEEYDLDVEDSRPNNIIHHARSSQNSMISQQPLNTKDKTSLNPAYPEGYNTIDRRLRKKVRDPVGLVNTRMECIGENFFNPDLALLRQKRGELVLRQVAEMEEEDEKMMPCLRPYKNGLFYKTRMQAKNKVGETLRDHMAYQDEEETRLRLSIDPNSEGSDEMQGSEEELEEFCSEISQHYKHYKKVSSFCGYSDDKPQGYCDRKTTNGKIGGWTPEDMLSPVEEPSDEYVDPIDELQCLVETVSEYLAEKEEEINKYGSLPETSKSRLSSKGSARTESFGDEITSKELKEDKALEIKEIIFSEQGSGKKNAKNSLFSSLTDRIMPSSKQTRSNSIQCSETSDYALGSSGLSKLLSFMTKSPSPAPVALVSPTQETPPDKRTFLMPTQPSDAKPQEIIQRTPPMSNTQMQNNSDIINQNVNECQPPSSVSSELKQVNPQNFSEGGVNETSKNFSEVISRNELNRSNRHSLDQSNDMQDFRPSGDKTRPVTVFVERHTKTNDSETISQKSTADLGFFSPLKKTFSSLISPGPCMPSQHQTQTAFPVFRSENDVRETKSLDASSRGNKMEVPVLDSGSVPTQQPPKVERAMFSGLLQFASGDNTGELESSPKNTVKPAQTAPSKSNYAAKVSLNPNKSSSPAQNLAETQPMMTLETSWFSSLKTAPSENVQAASPQGQRLMNQSSRPPTGSSQNTVRSEHQKPVKEVNEDIHNMQQTPKTNTSSTAEPNTFQPDTQGLFSTLFKSLSSVDTAGPKTALHSVEGGLFSGIMKFASTGDVSKDTQSNPMHPRNEPSQATNPAQTHLENQPHTRSQAHKTSPSGVPFVSSKKPPQHRDSTGCQLSQQPPPPEQASSQKGSILSGLFKLISSDSISNNQANSWQHENVPASIYPSHQPSKQNVQGHHSRISNDHTDRQKIIEGCSRKSDKASQPASEHGGFFSGLFKFSSDNLSSAQTASTQQSKPKNVRQSSLESKSTEQYPPLAQENTQSEILSGIFNKLRASTEEGAQSKWAPHNQKQQWKGVQNEDSSQNVPSCKQETQLHTEVRDQMPPDSSGQSVQRVDQRGCVKTSTSLISNTLKKHSNESPSGVDMEMDKETNGNAMFASHPYRCNGTIINNVPVYSDDNNLDLRTLASYERSQQMNAAYISDSTGHLPDMSNFPDSSSLNHVKNLYSTDNHPISPVGLTGQVQTPQPYLTQSYPSLYSFPELHACHNNSFYGLGPNFEHYWSQNSVLRERMNNHTMSYDPWKYSYAPSLEALLELSQSLNMNVDENQQYYSTHDWMAFNNSQKNNLQQQEYHKSIANNLNVQKMWSTHNSLDMLNNCGSCIEGEGALNLSKKGNAKLGSWQSFSEEGCYSLNTVAYPEGYFEEHPTNLSYSANRENICTRTYRQPASSECYPGLIGCPNGWNYTSADIEDYAYFEDTEWYQQWLLLLEQGMWWQADDGDCGYFVYTDHEYIYALLTDGSGQYVYACAPEDEVWGNGHLSDNYPSALLHNEMVMVCGFKIPLYNEDELFWFPGQDQSESQLLNAPLDLSDAYKKGNEIMNLNLERFSQIFESSIPAQRQQAIDFSLYQLNKVKMDTRQQTQNDFANQDSVLEVLDLRANGPNCNLNNRRTKELLSQKVCISICPTPTTHSSGVYNCYQPRQRRHSSFGLQVKHIDDISQEEWQKRLQPGEELSKKPIKKIPSLFSSLVVKSQESESNRNINGSKTFTTAINATHPGMIQEKSSVREPQSDKEIKSIPSTGLQGIKSKTIKNDVSPSSTPKESTNQQPSEIGSSRILSKIPSSVSAQGATHKPKLARQATVSQQSSISEVSTKSTNVPIKSISSIDTQGGKKPSEQNQGGFLSFFRNAIGIEEPSQESVKSSQAVTKQTEKNKYILDGVKDSSTDKGTGTTKRLGSVEELLNMENTTSQLPSKESYSQKSSAHQTFGSRNDTKETGYVYQRTSESEWIQKPQRQSRFHLGSQSDIPKTSQTPQEQMPKSVSQIFSLDVNDKLISGDSQTMPTIGCNKSEPSTKSTSGLFGFSIANSGRMNNKEETAGRGLLSMFNDSSPQQVPPQRESASQCQVGGESSENTIGNRILSLFGSSNTENAALLNQTEKAPRKETSSIGLLSVFNASSTKQTSTLHTGSSNQASPKEAPGIKVLHVFSGHNPQKNSLQTRSTNQQSSHGIAHQDPPNTASQETGSIFGGILGGLSTYNEKPVKSLFSRFGGSSPQPSSTPRPTTGLTADTEIPEKVAPKQQQGIEVIDDAQKPQPAINNLQETIPLKEPPGKGLLSLFGVHNPQQNTPQATSIRSGFLSGSNGNKGTAKGLLSMFGKLSHEQNAKNCLQINAQANLSPGESSMENEQPTKCSVKYMPVVSSAPTPQQPDYIESVLPDDKLPIFSTPSQPTSIPLPAETPGTGLLSMLSEVHFQSNEAPHVQICTSLETVSAVPKDIASNVDTISVPMESTSNLPTPPICSRPEVTSQNAASGLLSMFSGSNSQNTAPQARSVLSGIFPDTTGQKDIPGKSMFSMFSGSSSKSTSYAEDHGPSVSKEPGRSLFAMFGGTRPQEPPPPTSLLGGIFPGGITPKDVSGRGLLSMFSGHSPTTPSQTEATSKPPEAEGHFNVSVFSQGNTSEDILFSEEKNLELEKSQDMSSGLCGADDKTANIVSGDSTKRIQGKEPMTLQPQSASSKQQNTCHSITEAEKETIEGKSTADSQDMKGSPAFSGELVSNTHSWPEQNEKQNLQLHKIQPQPKQEDMTAITDSGADKGQKNPADVEKSAFDTSAGVVSGFMSKMFSGTSEPFKTSSGLLYSAQTSFFKSTSTKGSESQQATSLFGLPSSLPTDSLKSDLLGMFKSHQTIKPAEANLNLNSTPSTEATEFAVQDQRVPNDIISSSGEVKLTENLIKTESDLAQQSLHQVIKSDSFTNLTPASVNPHEVTSLTMLSNDEVIESDIVTGKPIVIVGEPENTLMDKSGPSQQPLISEPSQSMFGIAGLSLPKFSFITESEDASKSFGSLFSSAAKGLPTMPQTGGGGLLFGFKSFSTSVFSDEKPVASNNEPTSLFGAKLGLWQKEAPIPIKKQSTCVVAAQPNSPGYPKSTSETDLSLLISKEVKENVNKIDNDNEIIHGIVMDLDSSEFEDQSKSIDTLDDSKLQISMSTLKIDCPSQKEQESQIQLPSSAALSSGLQQEYMELLSAKRLVTS